MKREEVKGAFTGCHTLLHSHVNKTEVNVSPATGGPKLLTMFRLSQTCLITCVTVQNIWHISQNAG